LYSGFRNIHPEANINRKEPEENSDALPPPRKIIA
jgi:hypothetical protein